jgi:hypothetical protein
MSREYQRGFQDGFSLAQQMLARHTMMSSDDLKAFQGSVSSIGLPTGGEWGTPNFTKVPRSKPKRKLSAWNKFVKANSKKKKYIYQSGAKKGKLNLKRMGIDFRKKKR